jgi:hypothetical protein
MSLSFFRSVRAPEFVSKNRPILAVGAKDRDTTISPSRDFLFRERLGKSPRTSD